MRRYLTNPRTTAASALILAAFAPFLNAQNPRTQSQSSHVQLPAQTGIWPGVGALRDLKCRGKPGIDIRVHQDPSPRTPSMVTMVMRYALPKETRSLSQVGMGTVDNGVTLQLIPGSCTWRFDGARNIPAEPGVVYFDIPRNAQSTAAARDTSIDVAMNFPDVVSLPRYLSDSTRYWGFYVDDAINVSISYGPRGRPAPPISFGERAHERSSSATIRSGATAKPGTASKPATTGGSSTVRTSPGTDKVSAPKPSSVSGPLGAAGSTASPARPLPDARTSGNPTAGTATVVRAPLQLRGVSTILGGFTVSFSARSDVLPTLHYSTEQPVRDGRTGLLTFPGGRAATNAQEVGGLSGKPFVLPGSPAVLAGTQAEVVRRSTAAFRAEYTATSRPRTVGRGKVYHYIITVPASADFAQEQFMGRLTTVSQTVRMTITSFTLLKSNIYAKDLKYDFVAWTDVGGGGPFAVCQSATCANAGDYLRLLVFAAPPQKPYFHSVPSQNPDSSAKPDWNAQPSPIMGIARREFDLRTIPDDRPLRAFTLRSRSGDIEFEVQGTLEVVRR